MCDACIRGRQNHAQHNQIIRGWRHNQIIQPKGTAVGDTIIRGSTSSATRGSMQSNEPQRPRRGEQILAGDKAPHTQPCWLK